MSIYDIIYLVLFIFSLILNIILAKRGRGIYGVRNEDVVSLFSKSVEQVLSHKERLNSQDKTEEKND